MLHLSAQGASDKGQQMAISTENIKRMMAITSGELQEQDFSFFRNHITPFVEWLVDNAVNDLVGRGIERDFAEALINTVSHLSKMSGANDLFDFGLSSQILEENGLTDNA